MFRILNHKNTINYKNYNKSEETNKIDTAIPENRVELA